MISDQDGAGYKLSGSQDCGISPGVPGLATVTG